MQKKFLVTQLETKNQNEQINIIPRFENLNYISTEDGAYFNASYFYQKEVIERDENYEDGDSVAMYDLLQSFIGSLSFVINQITDIYEIDNKEAFKKHNNELWIHTNLDTTFLCFCFPEMITESMDYMRSILRFNFAIPDSVLNSLASTVLPSEAIERILNARKGIKEDDE